MLCQSSFETVFLSKLSFLTPPIPPSVRSTIIHSNTDYNQSRVVAILQCYPSSNWGHISASHKKYINHELFLKMLSELHKCTIINMYIYQSNQYIHVVENFHWVRMVQACNYHHHHLMMTVMDDGQPNNNQSGLNSSYLTCTRW